MEEEYAGTSVRNLRTHEAENAGHSGETAAARTGTDSARTPKEPQRQPVFQPLVHPVGKSKRVCLGETKGSSETQLANSSVVIHYESAREHHPSSIEEHS